MTRREAVELSIELWTWLAANPASPKDDHPELGHKVLGWDGECALCEYARKESECNDWYCEWCPMSGRWPGEDGLHTNCCDAGAVFDAWDDNVVLVEVKSPGYINYDTSFFCLVMCEAYQELIDEMDAEAKREVYKNEQKK